MKKVLGEEIGEVIIDEVDLILVEKDKLENWYKLLKAEGINSKAVVRDEIKNVLEQFENEDDSLFKETKKVKYKDLCKEEKS